MKLIKWICLAFLLVSTAYADQSVTKNIVVISDIHFDPFLSCDNSKPCRLVQQLRRLPATQWASVLSSGDSASYRYKHNTNYALLQSMLKAAGEVAQANHVHSAFILGDDLAHHFRRQYKKYSHDYSRNGYRAFVRKTLQFISLEAAKALPGISIYNIIGNNDTYNYDYTSYPEGQFFHDTAVTWSHLIKSHANAGHFRREFSYAGYYALNIAPGLKLIALNSVLFSKKARGKNIEEASAKQLQWFARELEDAKAHHQKVFIAMHIPSSVDILAHLRYRFLRLFDFWRAKDVLEFESILNRYSGEVKAIFVGHLHRDWFQTITLGNHNTVPVLGTPAVSPVYGNYPGFKLYRFVPEQFTLDDFKTYYLPKGGTGWQAAWRTFRPGGLVCHYAKASTRLNKRHLITLPAAGKYSSFSDRLTSRKWRLLYQCSMDDIV